MRRQLPRPLPIKRPLILQPPSIPLHTPDLLAIKVRHRIIRARAHGIYSVFLYAFVEPLFFDVEGGEAGAVEDPPDTVADDGAEQPAEEHGGEGGEAHRDDGVGGDEL